MKTTGICPKCQTASVARLKAYKGSSTANVIRFSQWGTRAGYFDRYVCTGCGYLEDYARLEDRAWQKWIREKRDENSLESDFV